MPFHVLNGDTTRQGLVQSRLPGEFLVWTDLLHEGPVPRDVGTADTRRVRAEYLASAGYGNREDISRALDTQDVELDRWFEFGEIVLWLEHDLFDQLILLRHLAWLARTNGATERSRLICRDQYLGNMTPATLASLFDERVPITGETVQTGAEIWDALTSDDPAPLVRRSKVAPPEGIPFVPGALTRLLEEYPGAIDGLARSERQILRAIEEGSDTLGDCFQATQSMEERIFMGDTTFLRIARSLSAARDPLMTLAPMPGAGPFRYRVETTPFGRAVLAGHRNNLQVNGIDRWVGGVHLSGFGPTWCWTGDQIVWR